MGGAAPSAAGRTRKMGIVERYKAFRDRYRLKPLLVAVLYLVVPVLTFQLILVQYPGLDPARFHRATMYIVPAAMALTAVAFVQDGQPKGGPARLVLDFLYVTLSLVWMIAIIGGNPVIRSEYESHPFSIDVSPLIAIGAFTAGLNFVHDAMEYYYYRGPAAGTGAPSVAGTSGAGGGAARGATMGGLYPAGFPSIRIFGPAAISASFSMEIADWPVATPGGGMAAMPGAGTVGPMAISVDGGPEALGPVPEATARQGNIEAGFEIPGLTPDLHPKSTQS